MEQSSVWEEFLNMAISDDLFRAILAMDSYDRGYNAAVTVNGSALSNASLGSNSTTLLLDANNNPCVRNGHGPKWRTLADEDGHYSFALAL